MTEFIPPYPKRPDKQPGVFELLKLANANWLAIWPASVFERQFIVLKLADRTLAIANHPEVVQHALVDRAANYASKGAFLGKLLRPLLGDALFINSGANCPHHRALLAPMVDAASLDAYGPGVAAVTEPWLRRWARQDGATVPVLTEMRAFIGQVCYRLLFGEDADPSRRDRLLAAFAAYTQGLEQMDLGALLGLPAWLAGKGGVNTAKTAELIRGTVDLIVAAGDGGDGRCVLGQMLRLPAGHLPPATARNELIGLFLAGHQTVANTLAWACYLVSMRPEVGQRLAAELATVAGEGMADFAVLDRLTYTRAVIKETLRLYPPMPLLMREAAAADTIRGRTLPKGAVLLVVPWLLHRHTLYWERPDHFLPERFLNPDGQPDPQAYLPFGVGGRDCVSGQLGMALLVFGLANVAKRFAFESTGQPPMPVCRLLLRPSNDLPMRLTARPAGL